MASTKPPRVPVAADRDPLLVGREKLDRTPEIADGVRTELPVPGSAVGAPLEVVTDEVTVPVHSSIESSLTFELLRRQSTGDEEDEDT